MYVSISRHREVKHLFVILFVSSPSTLLASSPVVSHRPCSLLCTTMSAAAVPRRDVSLILESLVALCLCFGAVSLRSHDSSWTATKIASEMDDLSLLLLSTSYVPLRPGLHAALSRPFPVHVSVPVLLFFVLF